MGTQGIVVTVTGSALVLAHIAVGAPNLARTVSPALSVAFLFNLFTANKLRRERPPSEESS